MHEDVFSMTVDREMVNYFSRLESRINPASFLEIYCLNPPKDDGCPVGICPNPDIAGPLVRIARKFSFSFLRRMVVQRLTVKPVPPHQITLQRSV